MASGRFVRGRSSRNESVGRSKIVDGDNANRKGPLGLNLLHAANEPVVDFIFVHGLGGGSRKTWSKTSDPDHYWPKKLLSDDSEFSRVRIHSFGYKADYMDWNRSGLNLHDFAVSLLGEISTNPMIKRSQTKIVLIAHSMGGLVVKQMYISARLRQSMKGLASRFHAIVFLATPHRGSHLAKTLDKLLKASFGSRPFVKALNPNSESIATTNDLFRLVCEDLQLWSFYETVPLNMLLGLIVDPTSAVLGYPKEHPVPLNANHRSICKFDSASDPNYISLRNCFVTILDSISREPNARHMNDQICLLTRFTGISNAPIDEFLALEEARLLGSCEWLQSNQEFVSWRRATSAPSIFLLAGNGGTGKSFISSFFINSLKKQSLKPSYFFFKHGIAAKSTVASCLLSLVYQMATSNASILEKILDSQHDCDTWEQWDENTIWRRLFMGCIFQIPALEPHFWVIDGLDECQKPGAFLTLIAKVPSFLRIFITSCAMFEIDKALTAIAGSVSRYELQEKDTLKDLDVFISSKMHLLPVAVFESQAAIKKMILEKACGSFLWVSLTVQELQHVISKEGAQQVLDELLPGMNALYARMLNVSKNMQSISLTRAILTWSLLTFRTLSVDELQQVLQLNIEQTIPNLTKHIPVLCGQLIRVDLSNHLRCIHQSARTFLLNQVEYPDLSISKLSGHTNISRVCLKFLKDRFGGASRSTRPRDSLQSLDHVLNFTSYASIHFSEHLLESAYDDEAVWKLLSQFLEHGVFSWMEYLSSSGKIHHITRTAMNLKSYFERRAIFVSPATIDANFAKTWAQDIIRVSAKFRNNLVISPSCIHTMIPALCPSESVIAKYYASRRCWLLVRGPIEESWDECLARIDFSGVRAIDVAYGDRYFAVALSNKSIRLYFHDSMLAKTKFDNGEHVRALAFSTNDRYLAAGGLRYVTVWDTETMTQVRVFETKELVLALIFSDDNETLAAATQGNCLLTWDLSKDSITGRWPWNEAFHEDDVRRPSLGVPDKATCSSDSNILAVAYRSLLVYLFDVQNKKFIGGCQRFADKTSFDGGNQYFVDAMTFNSNPEIDALVVSYGDGELIVYDVWTAELRSRCPAVFAHSLTCSPDGRTLVTGCARGIIQVFEFAGVYLNPIYRIYAHEEASRGIAISGDGRRFAEVHALQCRIWEPACLVRNDQDKINLSKGEHSPTVTPRSVKISGGPRVSEITVMCPHPSGKLVFCGKSDGEVSYVDLYSATQPDSLYRHGVNTTVRGIAFNEQRSFLYTSDGGGYVWIHEVSVSEYQCKIVRNVTKLQIDFAIQGLLPSPRGDELIVQGKGSVYQYTITEEKEVKTPFSVSDFKDDDFKILNHPLEPDYLILMNRWQSEVIPRPTQYTVGQNGNGTHGSGVPQTTISGDEQTSGVLQPTRQLDKQFSLKFQPLVAEFYPPRRSIGNTLPAALRVWRSQSLSTLGVDSNPLDLYGFEKLVDKIRQVISVVGSEIFFLDQDFWICSIDIGKCTKSRHGAVRHFFVLPEWSRDYNSMIVEYLPQRREFVIARKQAILVIQRGLDLQEPWYPNNHFDPNRARTELIDSGPTVDDSPA